MTAILSPNLGKDSSPMSNTKTIGGAQYKDVGPVTSKSEPSSAAQASGASGASASPP